MLTAESSQKGGVADSELATGGIIDIIDIAWDTANYLSPRLDKTSTIWFVCVRTIQAKLSWCL